jgi:rhodanese-related sulfurtransferase
MRDLRPAELRTYLLEAEPAPLLIDVREPWEYEVVRLPDTRLVPLRTVPGLVGELDPAQELVLLCHHGVRSRQAAWFLERNGFERVINLAGGIDAWARELDPTMPRY